MNIEFYVPDKKISSKCFDALIYNDEKKINVPKGGRFCRVYEHKD